MQRVVEAAKKILAKKRRSAVQPPAAAKKKKAKPAAAAVAPSPPPPAKSNTAEEAKAGSGRTRYKYSAATRRALEAAFLRESTPNLAAREKLAGALGLSERQVRNWFSNHKVSPPSAGGRARTR